jgi:membrane protease YdiL (CAAX protease family)
VISDGNSRPSKGWTASLTGLTVALVLPALLTSLAPKTPTLAMSPALAIALNEAAVWALTLAVIAIVLFWERRPLSSIGLGRPSWSAVSIGIAVTAGLGLLAMGAVYALQDAGMDMPEGQENIVLGIPVWLQLLVAASAGFTEEILFRGYAIERLTELTGNRWVGAILPIIVFGAVHAPFWGIAHAIVAGLSGLWLTLLYLWRRNLWTNITAHALLDGLVFIAVDMMGPDGVASA